MPQTGRESQRVQQFADGIRSRRSYQCSLSNHRLLASRMPDFDCSVEIALFTATCFKVSAG